MGALAWSLAAVGSTTVGGLVALHLRERSRFLPLVATAALLAFVCVDLIPESVEWAGQSGSAWAPFAAIAVGLALFTISENLALRRCLPAGLLVGHSFLDGVGIGLAFQHSAAFGLTVAATVVVHDFIDGLNTVSLMLGDRGATRPALGMLALDAAAPLLGAASTLAWSFPPGAMAGYLGFFAGMLVSVVILHARSLA